MSDSMDVRAVAFDVNGTLVDIHTEEGSEQVFRAAAHFLTYQGIDVRRHELRDQYFHVLKQQQKTGDEEYPEYSAESIWIDVIAERATDFTRALPADKLRQLPLFLAELTRGVSRRRLRPYPFVPEVLTALRAKYPLAVVTDAQSAWARPELHKAGLLDFFDQIIVSGDYGYRKPDPRLFQLALDALGVTAEQTVYVGNDMYRDVFGAQELGMRTILFDSDQGTKHHPDTAPDFTITDHRDLLAILKL